MNILCINPYNGLGGGERVFTESIRALHQAGHQCVVVLTAHTKEQRFEELIRTFDEQMVVRKVKFPIVIQIANRWKTEIRRLLCYLTVLPQLVYYIKKYHIDVVYSNSMMVQIGVIASLLTHTKHVWHIHDMPNYLPMFHFSNRDIRFCQKYMKCAWNTNIFICNYQRTAFEAFCNTAFTKHPIVYNPLDDYVYSMHPLCPKGTLRFGFAGGFDERKQAKVLLKIFEQFHTSHKDTSLTMVGGDEKTIQQMYTTTDLREPTLSLRTVENDIDNFYSNIDVLVLPSLTESWGLVVLEAIVKGCACICTQNTGLKELFSQEEIFFIDPYEQRTIYEALEKCLDKKVLEQRVLKSQQKLQVFSEKHSFRNELINLFT